METEQDVKWLAVLSKSNEILYFVNKITGQFRWTSQNCSCQLSKVRNPKTPLLPCCIKQKDIETSKHQKGHDIDGDVNVRLLSEKSHCLSDIIKEIKIAPIKRKRYRTGDRWKPIKKKKKIPVNVEQNNDKDLPDDTVVSMVTDVAMAADAINSDNASLSAQSDSLASNTNDMDVSHNFNDDGNSKHAEEGTCSSHQKKKKSKKKKEKAKQRRGRPKKRRFFMHQVEIATKANIMMGTHEKLDNTLTPENPTLAETASSVCIENARDGQEYFNNNLRLEDPNVAQKVSSGDAREALKSDDHIVTTNVCVDEQENQINPVGLNEFTVAETGSPLPLENYLKNEDQIEGTAQTEMMVTTHDAEFTAGVIPNSCRLESQTHVNVTSDCAITVIGSNEDNTVDNLDPNISCNQTIDIEGKRGSLKDFPNALQASSDSSKHIASALCSENPHATLPNTLKNTQSLSVSSDCRETSCCRVGRGRPRKVLLPNDLPTMVALPAIPSLPESPSTPSNHSDDSRWYQNTPTIQFVSDSNLVSGAMFFTPSDGKKAQKIPKKIEQVAESLKSTSTEAVKGDSSVQTAAWLINVLSEIDFKKNRPKIATVESNGQFSEVSPTVVPARTSLTGGPCASSSAFTTHRNGENMNNSLDVKHNANTQPPPTVNNPKKYCNHITEIHASYVDLSWRIVTSTNGYDSSSLSNFYKLVPVRVKDNGTFAFLGVPVHGTGQVIAKILNTSVPQEQDDIFVFESAPSVARNDNVGKNQKKVTLSFAWEQDTVIILPKCKSNSRFYSQRLNLEHCPPLKENSLALQLPKPLKLPEKDCKVYLGDFQVISNDVEFVVSHCAIVLKSPRTLLSIPTNAVAESMLPSVHVSPCRVVGIAKNNVKKSEKPTKPTKIEETSFSKCQLCGGDIKTLIDIRRHRRMHTSAMGFKCTECPRRFLTGGRLSIHLVTHKCHVLHQCEKCGKHFKTPKLLSSKALLKYFHKLCKTCRGKMKCNKCSLKFNSLEELHDHALHKHCMKCRICGNSFLYKEDLKKHMMGRHKIPSYP